MYPFSSAGEEKKGEKRVYFLENFLFKSGREIRESSKLSLIDIYLVYSFFFTHTVDFVKHYAFSSFLLNSLRRVVIHSLS